MTDKNSDNATITGINTIEKPVAIVRGTPSLAVRINSTFRGVLMVIYTIFFSYYVFSSEEQSSPFEEMCCYFLLLSISVVFVCGVSFHLFLEWSPKVFKINDSTIKYRKAFGWWKRVQITQIERIVAEENLFSKENGIIQTISIEHEFGRIVFGRIDGFQQKELEEISRLLEEYLDFSQLEVIDKGRIFTSTPDKKSPISRTDENETIDASLKHHQNLLEENRRTGYRQGEIYQLRHITDLYRQIGDEETAQRYEDEFKVLSESDEQHEDDAPKI